MSDQLADGRSFRTLNVQDVSVPALRVIRTLERIIEWRGKPINIRVDNGPENVSFALREWASGLRIGLQYIQPGKPQQNAYVQRFNRTVRQEWLGQYHFDTLEQVQDHATLWLCTARQAIAKQMLRVDLQQRTDKHGNRRNSASTEAQKSSINSIKTPRYKWGDYHANANTFAR